MLVKKSPFLIVGVTCLLVGLSVPGKADEKKTGNTTTSGQAVLWRDPVGIESRNLFFGPGGSEHVPAGTFTFVKEDLDGTNPKFVVKDQNGTKWKVKMGIETRPETVASRIVWAVGYFANSDYFVRDLHVTGMPARLHRGSEFVASDGTLHDVRLKLEPSEEKKIGTWRWRHDVFAATRELNGLKTLMAVLNNWDLKDANNTIYQVGDQRVYMVSDLGAAFGSAGRSWPKDKSKGNIENYQKSKFIRRMTATTVDFQTPARPAFIYWINPKEYVSRIRLESIGHKVPRADAKWMGGLLNRISADQFHDAFRAAGYSPEEADQFYKVMATRITALSDL